MHSDGGKLSKMMVVGKVGEMMSRRWLGWWSSKDCLLLLLFLLLFLEKVIS